jgi:hypothetical protein
MCIGGNKAKLEGDKKGRKYLHITRGDKIIFGGEGGKEIRFLGVVYKPRHTFLNIEDSMPTMYVKRKRKMMKRPVKCE